MLKVLCDSYAEERCFIFTFQLETSQQIQQLQGACYDMEQTLNGARSVVNSKKHFAAVHELMKNSIFLAQHIQYERTRRFAFSLHGSIVNTVRVEIFYLCKY